MFLFREGCLYIKGMNTYIALKLPITDPNTGETRTLKLFGVGEHTVQEWERIFSKGNKFEDIIKEPFQITKPVDIKDLSAFPGFIDFITALDTEETE